MSPALAWLGYARNYRLPVARSVRLPACGHRYTLYVGGIYVKHPACVVLNVTAAGRAARKVLVKVPVAMNC